LAIQAPGITVHNYTFSNTDVQVCFCRFDFHKRGNPSDLV
jgi:hypothetical protein